MSLCPLFTASIGGYSVQFPALDVLPRHDPGECILHTVRTKEPQPLRCCGQNIRLPIRPQWSLVFDAPEALVIVWLVSSFPLFTAVVVRRGILLLTERD